jgi:hypothetical protein
VYHINGLCAIDDTQALGILATLSKQTNAPRQHRISPLPMEENPKHRRRWFRLSQRALVLLTSISSLFVFHGCTAQHEAPIDHYRIVGTKRDDLGLKDSVELQIDGYLDVDEEMQARKISGFVVGKSDIPTLISAINQGIPVEPIETAKQYFSISARNSNGKSLIMVYKFRDDAMIQIRDKYFLIGKWDEFHKLLLGVVR